LKRNRQENINTSAYWDRVYARERAAGRRRLYEDLWRPMLLYLPQGSHTLVDVGCGAGEFLKFLSHHRPEYQLFGTDISAEGLLTAGQNCPGASLHLASGDSFNLPHGKFDIAVVSEVMEHVAEPAPFLSRVIDLLKPAGLLLITTPWKWGSSDPEHVWDYEGPEDFVSLGRGRVQLMGSAVANRGFTLITVLYRG